MVAFIRASDNLFSTVSSMTLLARLYVLQGRLRQAASTYARVAQVVPRPEGLQTAFSSLFYYLAWATCCASATIWVRLNGTWHKAWHWSRRR